MPQLAYFPIRLNALVTAMLSGVLPLTLPPARAQDLCAVTLTVTGPNGEPTTSTWIELVDQSGKVVRREQIWGSEYKMCDFGFGPHTLRVGTNESLPVAVSNLRVDLRHPVVLKVVLNPAYGDEMRSGCLVYFRTADADHKPLPGVHFSPELDVSRQPVTDGFGRWQSLFGGDRDLTFAKPGFAPTTAHIHCQQQEEVDLEIVMRANGSANPAK
jgi:hypothetical protein